MPIRNAIPPELQDFLSSNVDSIEQLEVLLLVAGKPETTWTADEVATALNLPVPSAARQLDTLCARNLLDVRLGSQRLVYQWNPGTAELSAGAELLRQEYRTNRLAVLSWIVEGAPEPMRTFADAFVIKKKKKGGK